MLVVLLLIDGLGYEYLGKDSFWAQHSMRIENSLPSITAPNWLAIMTGLKPIDHGILNNEMFRPKTFRYTKSTTLFDDFQESTFVSDWKVFSKVSAKPKFVYANIWKWCQKQKLCGRSDNLLVLNYMYGDNIGHAYGWGSPQYQATIKYIDEQTSALYEKLMACGDPFVLVGVADHGGDEHKDHENEHDAKTRNIPLMVVSNMPIQKPLAMKRNTEIRAYLQKLIKRV